MSVVAIKLNLPGINEIMKSSEMQSVIQRAGEIVAADAGEDYIAETRVINWICICNVYPNSAKAANDNFRNNSLLKALSSSGLKMTKGA